MHHSSQLAPSSLLDAFGLLLPSRPWCGTSAGRPRCWWQGPRKDGPTSSEAIQDPEAMRDILRARYGRHAHQRGRVGEDSMWDL